MDGPGQSERIEIELTSHTPAREGPGPAAAEGVASDEGADPKTPDRTRTLAVVIAAGVAGLAIGWLLGRTTASDGDDALATDAEPAAVTTVVPEVAVPEATAPVETLPAPTTTRAPTTTTTAPPPDVRTVEIDDRVAGLPIELVGLRFDNRLFELDLGTGTLTERQVPSTSGFDPSLIVAGDDWILLPRSSASKMRVLHDDGTETELEAGEQWALVPIAGTDEFWRAGTQMLFDEPLRYQRITIDGTEVGEPLEMPWRSWALAADPAGGLVTSFGGKVYRVDESGARQLAVGELLGLSERTVVVRDCDEVLECGVRVVDRDTGELRVLPPDADAGPLFDALVSWGPNRRTVISPDERSIIVVEHTSSSMRAGAIDLETGVFTEITDQYRGESMVWSPDSRFLFHLAGGLVTVFDRSTGERFPAGDQELIWTSLTARPMPSA